ncbi:hypothetical protein Tco_0524282 [Tanacetum coccineum]
MSSITAQQTKLDLELVPKENRFDIGKCNGRIPRGSSPREPTFQVTLDAIALTPCYPAFLITADVPEVYMHQFWNSVYKHDDFYRFKIDKKKRFKHTLEILVILGISIHSMILLSIRCINIEELLPLLLTEAYQERRVEDFTYQIDNKDFKKQEKMYYPRFIKVIIHHFLIQEKTLSWRNKIRMPTSKDDYLINTLRFVSRKEASQIYGAVLLECLTSPEMKESKAYKTYLGHATGVVPPKIARKFKKASPTKKNSDLVPVDEEPIMKGKRVKRSVKKSSTKPTTGIIIREPPVKTKSKGKEKENVDVAYSKGIELLSEVALTKKALLKEVRKKSLRDLHKTHPSSFGTGAEKPPSVEKITPTITSERTGDKPGVLDVTEDNSTESESESWGNDEDDNNNEQEASDEGSGQENESKEQEYDSEQDEESNDDNQEGEEVDQENESKDDEIESDEDKGIDDTTNQFDDDKKEVPVTSSSRSSDLASKFLNFLDIPQIDAEIVSPLDVYVHHEVPRTQAPTLLIIPVSVITKSSPAYTNIPQSSQTFTPSPILTTPTPLPTIETTNPLSNLPDFASIF